MDNEETKKIIENRDRGTLMDLNNSIYTLACYLCSYLVVLRRHIVRR